VVLRLEARSSGDKVRQVCVHKTEDLREVDVATDLHQEDFVASPLEGITAWHQGVRC